MSINWDEVKRALSPLKDYEDARRRWQESFAYPLVRETYNFSLPRLADYTRLLLGGDARSRYTGYMEGLLKTGDELQQAGVRDILDLTARLATREQVELFTGQSGIGVMDLAALLKYLIYWVIPAKKLLSGLVREEAHEDEAVSALRAAGMRANLDLLQQGITAAGRGELAERSGLPEPVILAWVNRADFSRLPWASKATISNIMGAGYGSLSRLAKADPEQLYRDFFRYGNTIGKNLKLGNEIENSHRIAKILPRLVDSGE